MAASSSTTIGGSGEHDLRGSSEVLRSLVAEQLLGLPRSQQNADRGRHGNCEEAREWAPGALRDHRLPTRHSRDLAVTDRLRRVRALVRYCLEDSGHDGIWVGGLSVSAGR
jgi:hypothetical protein